MLNFQPRQKQHSSHFGSSEYANLLVQFGASKLAKRSSRATKKCATSGSLAGLLIETEHNFSAQEIEEALAESFASGKQVMLNAPRDDIGCRNGAKAPAKWRIYCDLDGVLADFDKGVRSLTKDSADCESKEVVMNNTLWSRVQMKGDFFQTLDWNMDGQRIWSLLEHLGRTDEPLGGILDLERTSDVFSTQQLLSPPQILTGLPWGKLGKTASSNGSQKNWAPTYWFTHAQVQKRRTFLQDPTVFWSTIEWSSGQNGRLWAVCSSTTIVSRAQGSG